MQIRSTQIRQLVDYSATEIMTTIVTKSFIQGHALMRT